MCRVTYFCCGCSLTAGAITAAVLQALNSLGILIVAIITFLGASYMRTEDPEVARISFMGKFIYAINQDAPDPQQNISYEKFFESWIETRADRAETARILDISAGVIIVITFISLIILICLIIAICNKSHPWVIPWLIGNMIKLVLNCISGIIVLILQFFIFSPFIIGPLAFEIYMWIVMLNYYRQLKAPGYQPAIMYKA